VSDNAASRGKATTATAPAVGAPANASYERVIVLGLDSVTWDLLLPFVNDGTMPSLAAFLRTSNFGVLDSTVPPHTAAAWTTFLTGKDPGHHGIIDFVGFDPTQHKFRFHDSNTSRKDSILYRLSKANVPCGSIFLPRNYPPYTLKDGYMISGFETPGVNSRFTEPEELREEILGISPQFHFNFEDDWEDDKEDAAFARNIDRAIGAVDLLERLAVHFQRDRPVALQIAYLQATDILFHKAWRWCDPRTADANPVRREQVKKFFRRVDALCNRVLGIHTSSSASGRFKVGGPKTLRVIVSDHGHGASLGRVFINNLLRDWGYLTPLSGFRNASRKLRMLTMSAAARKAKKKELALDWSRTKAYLAHVGIYGFLYINLKGREPEGTVAAEDYDKVRNELIKRFLAEKIPGTKEPLFLQALKGEDIYARKKELNLPDLILVPADGYYPRKKLSRGPAVRMTPNGVGGIHRTNGVYAFSGPGVELTPAMGPRANIVDLAPTLLAALGQPVPTGMTGKPMLNVFQHPPQVQYAGDETPRGSTSDTRSTEPVYSKEEESEIEKRLSDLGYLE
jgi:predicted AlkP superfamily phosphohydrolase/phosphomutase